MTQLRFNFLGGFVVTERETQLDSFRSDKARALLAYLALEPRIHMRRVLAGLFWPDIAEKNALTNLRTTLHRLRQALAAAKSVDVNDLFIITRHTVEFVTETATTDVLQFEEVLDAASLKIDGPPNGQANGRANPPTAPSVNYLNHLSNGVSFYQGELLAGFSLLDAPAFDEWLLFRREELVQRALLAMRTLADGYETGGHFKEAHTVANRLLVLDPYREETHSQIMRLLAYLKLPDQALQAFEQMRQLFRAELGVEPSEESLALAQQIAAGEFANNQNDEMTGRQDDKITGTAPFTPSLRSAELTSKPHLSPSVAIGDTPSPYHPLTPLSSLDLRDIPDPGLFFGRIEERQVISQWLLHDRCQIVTILAIGGMGKTTLAAQWVREVAGTMGEDHFDQIFWRSLVNAPPLEELLPPLLQILSEQQLRDIPTSSDEQLRLLLGYLRDKRVILVLDNMESILEAERVGTYRPGYEPYEQLIQQMATYDHQSHLLLTSRERPRGYDRFEKDGLPVRSLQLTGLDDDASHDLLTQRGLSGDDNDEATLFARYSGNPLALKLVADTVDELFGGDLNEFLAEESLIFDDVRDILDQHFVRLTDLEQEILFWLAVEREGYSLAPLRKNLLQQPTQRNLVEGLRGLQRRALIQRSEIGFGLQNVIIEYLTDRLVEEVSQEIISGDLNRLHRQALIKAQAKEYVRNSQVRLLLAPISERLMDTWGQHGLARRLDKSLEQLRSDPLARSSYAGGNFLNLLLHLDIDVTDFDFSGLALWQACLQDKTLQNVNLQNADLRGALLTDSFGRIFAVDVSTDGALLAAGTDNGEVRLWSLPDMTPSNILQGHTNRVRDVAFSPMLQANGQLYSAPFENPSLLSPIKAGENSGFQSDRSIAEPVHSTQTSSGTQLLASASLDGSIRVWNAQTDELLRVFAEGANAFLAVAFSPDGLLLAGGGEDCTIYIWEVASGRLRCQFYHHTNWINGLAFHPDGSMLASASLDATVGLWDVTDLAFAQDSTNETKPEEGSKERLRHLFESDNPQMDSVHSIAFSHDGALLAIGARSPTIRIYRVVDKEQIWSFDGPGRVHAMCFSTIGRKFVATIGAVIYLWDMSDPEGATRSLSVLRSHTATIFSIAIDPASDTLFSGSVDETIRLWDIRNERHAQLIQSIHGYNAPVNALAFSEDGNLLVTGDERGRLSIWAFGRLEPHETEQSSISSNASPELARDSDLVCRHVLTDHTASIASVTFCPPGPYVASVGQDATLRLWDVQHGQAIDLLTSANARLWRVAFHPQYQIVAIAGTGNSLGLWRLDDSGRGKPLSAIQLEADTVRGLAFSQQEALLIYTNKDHQIRLWDVEGGTHVGTIETPNQLFWSIAMNVDDTILAGGERNGSIYLWDMRPDSRGETLATLEGHTSVIQQVVFSPDGKLLASASEDWTIRLWDVERSKLLYTIRGHTQIVTDVAFHPYGAVLASSSDDGTVKLWAVGDALSQGASEVTCLRTLRQPGPYEGMNITGVTGISEAQRAALTALGAVEE
ncbi:MAG: BTAD domain-containing putative transcriptional regulator [Chloroflexota bacterium]